MATQLDDAFFVIECINFAVTIVFLSFFIWRLWKLYHLATSQRYLNIYPKPRIILAIIYILVSIGLLTFNIIEGQFTDGFLYLLAGGGGQCINSIILIIQLIVLREQLKKERPYTCFHMIYSIYLVVISCIRFILTLYYLLSNIEVNIEKVDLTLTVFLMVDSTLLFGYWMAKRQELPEFQEIRYFNMDNFTNNSGRYMSRTIKFNETQFAKDPSQQDFPFIYPTVNIQKNNFRITLEIMANSTLLETQQQSKGKIQKNSKRLEVVNQGLYTADQLRQLYKLCGRFNMKNKVKFFDTNYVQLFKQMQLFLQQLFANPHYYHNFVLRFFNVSQQICEKILSMKGRSSYYDDQQQRCDLNAIFLSVCLYKHLWVDDHYIFYLRACSNEKEQHKSHPMKRYTDFQEFDNDLKVLLSHRKNGNCKYELPSLPKKHTFYWDEQKIVKRRRQLEIYIRNVVNDSNLMQFPQVRDRIFNFLHFKNIYDVNPKYKQNYYEGLDILKGNIAKALISDQDVTFYQFKLFNNGIQIGSIKKRFSQFVMLHQDLKRWMNNINITYKSIQLPQKHLFKSQSNRHQKLLQYLKNVIQIRDIYKVYELGVFFNIASDKTLDDDSLFGPISIVQTNRPTQRNNSQNPYSPTRSPTKINFKQQQQNQIQIPNSSYSSNQRMSRLIQELGKNQDFSQDI